MWAGEKGKVKEVESFTYHKMQIVRYATGGGVRFEGEGSVIVYAITTFWAQAKFPVLFMQQAADTYSTFVALGYTQADFGSYGNRLVGKIKQV